MDNERVVESMFKMAVTMNNYVDAVGEYIQSCNRLFHVIRRNCRIVYRVQSQNHRTRK